MDGRTDSRVTVKDLENCTRGRPHRPIAIVGAIARGRPRVTGARRPRVGPPGGEAKRHRREMFPTAFVGSRVGMTPAVGMTERLMVPSDPATGALPGPACQLSTFSIFR